MRLRPALALALAIAAVAAPAAFAAAGARPAYDCDRMRPSWAFDAKFGPNTEKAVKAYQAAKGLKVDGVVGMDTAWSLRITYRQPLKCGMVGPDVLELQRALARAGFWHGRFEAAAEPPMTHDPHPPVHPPMIEHPPLPTAPPEATPTPAPVAPPSEEMDLDDIPPDFELETPAPAMRQPWLEARLGTWLVPISGSWFIPVVAGGPPSGDFSVLRPNLTGDLALYVHPNWGAGLAINTFDLANPSFDLGPFSTAGMLMYDGHGIFRFADHYQLRAGYRGLSAGLANPQNFVKLGFRAERPMIGEWLWWHFALTGGSNFGTDYFYDGEGGLGLRFGLLGLDVGFRHLGLQIGAQPLATVNGPTIGAEIQF